MKVYFFFIYFIFQIACTNSKKQENRQSTEILVADVEQQDALGISEVIPLANIKQSKKYKSNNQMNTTI